jgi:hypothetical protein
MRDEVATYRADRDKYSYVGTYIAKVGTFRAERYIYS